MAGKFVITTTKNGEFTFNLKASNGEIILTASESYTTMNPKYELYQDKAGEFRFRLKAGNGENIGKSEGYKAKASAKKGIASIGKNAPDAPIVVIEE